MQKLAVIYRACNSEVGPPIRDIRPSWFSKIKCWQSFYKAFGGRDNVEIFVVFDSGQESELTIEIKKYKINTFESVNFHSNTKSMLHCYDKFKNELSDKFSYFALFEDDYEFKQKACDFLIDALELKYDPLSLFVHADRFIPTKHKNSIIFIGGGDVTLWNDAIGLTNYGYVRTIESTTGSFACSSDFFVREYDRLVYFATKGVGAPEDRSYWRDLYSRGTRLWAPVYSLSNHLVKSDMTPLW